MILKAIHKTGKFMLTSEEKRGEGHGNVPVFKKTLFPGDQFRLPDDYARLECVKNALATGTLQLVSFDVAPVEAASKDIATMLHGGTTLTALPKSGLKQEGKAFSVDVDGLTVGINEKGQLFATAGSSKLLSAESLAIGDGTLRATRQSVEIGKGSGNATFYVSAGKTCLNVGGSLTVDQVNIQGGTIAKRLKYASPQTFSADDDNALVTKKYVDNAIQAALAKHV